MPNETNALARPPAAPSEGDYQAFCAALSESERGRAFLAEYGRRNRSADTEMVLAALDRLTALVRADAAAVDRLRDELRMLLIAIRLARPEIDAAKVPGKAARLTVLVEMLERRIEAMSDTMRAEAAPPDAPDEPQAQDARARLAVVPPPDEPELPIPSQASTQPLAIALVKKEPAISAAMVPEVAFIESAAAEPAIAETPTAKTAAQPAPSRPEALAAIMTLSEDERLALFT